HAQVVLRARVVEGGRREEGGADDVLAEDDGVEGGGEEGGEGGLAGAGQASERDEHAAVSPGLLRASFRSSVVGARCRLLLFTRISWKVAPAARDRATRGLRPHSGRVRALARLVDCMPALRSVALN